MSIPVVKFTYEGERLHSPFTGKKVFSDQGFKPDKTVLFYYCGQSGEWDHVSDRARAALEGVSKKPVEDLSPETVCRKLTVPGALCYEVNAEWNGIYWVAFAPVE